MGKLVVLEGLDGSGKTTQLGLLCAALDARGTAYRKLEFPCYDSDSSMLVRMYLDGRFGGDPEDVNAYAASSFYAVDRYASYQSDWGPGYEAGDLFVAGRYTTSNAIHQGAKLSGAARLTYMDWLFDYEYRLLGLPAPDAVLYLDVEVPTALANIEKRQAARDIHETHAEYLGLCRKSALEAAARYGWHTVPCGADGAMRPAKDIAGDILKIINKVGIC